QKYSGQVESFDLAGLQQQLGLDSALVEYTTVGDELLAFVVTDKCIHVVRNLALDSEISQEIAGFRFQVDTLRFGSEAIRKHLPALTQKVRSHMESLYDQLLRPLEQQIGERRLVVVPHGALHYLPFHALYDGKRYLIEKREISYAPSAAILQQCLDRAEHPLTNALLLGVSDEKTPRVRDEIQVISQVFSKATSLLDQDATTKALRENSPAADVLHLACHAHFRSDNPLFSALRLADGWLTVRDAYTLKLNCGLVTLSACETGVNEVAPGDELIGLARGFFSAGCPSILLSLWMVDDEATAQLMADFYGELKNGKSFSSALRSAQMKMLEEKPHPFFWSPFVLLGRW
ncbi:MAG: CHAT domain-containing protein, partial [Pyrinomonadaceae bacterium]